MHALFDFSKLYLEKSRSSDSAWAGLSMSGDALSKVGTQHRTEEREEEVRGCDGRRNLIPPTYVGTHVYLPSIYASRHHVPAYMYVQVCTEIQGDVINSSEKLELY